MVKRANNIQKITANLEQLPRNFSPDVIASRVETGTLQINDDWPMTVVRGDSAAWYAMQLGILIPYINIPENDFQGNISLMTVKELIELFCSSNLSNSQSYATEHEDPNDQIGC